MPWREPSAPQATAAPRSSTRLPASPWPEGLGLGAQSVGGARPSRLLAASHAEKADVPEASGQAAWALRTLTAPGLVPAAAQSRPARAPRLLAPPPTPTPLLPVAPFGFSPPRPPRKPVSPTESYYVRPGSGGRKSPQSQRGDSRQGAAGGSALRGPAPPFPPWSRVPWSQGQFRCPPARGPRKSTGCRGPAAADSREWGVCESQGRAHCNSARKTVDLERSPVQSSFLQKTPVTFVNVTCCWGHFGCDLGGEK